MNNEIIYSNLGYTTEQIKKAISDSLNIEKVIRDKAYNFVNLSSFQNLNQATKPNTIYFVKTEAYSYLVFVLYQDDIITQIAMVSDGSIRYRTGTIQTIQSNEIFVPNMEFVSILSNYYNKEEIEDLFFEVNKRLDKLETPARVVSGTQKSLVGITTLQTEAGNVSDNNIAFGLSGAALIDIQGYVDIAFECSGEIAVYIDDEKVYYFDFNTWSYIGSPEFVGNISKGIRVTCTSHSSITFTRFGAPSYKGGILTDEQAEKVIKTEVFTKAEKDKLASSEVFTPDEKKELARVSSISDAGYVYIDTSLIDLKNKGILVTDAVVGDKTITGTSENSVCSEAIISPVGYVKMLVTGGKSNQIFVDDNILPYDRRGMFYEGYADTIKIVNESGLAVTFKTLEVAEFHGGHVTGEQVLDVELLKTNMKTAQEDISVIEGKLTNIYTKEETKTEISREIADLAETSAETLKTLEKLKEALGDGTESITAITDELAKKMEKAEIQAISDVKSPTVVYLYNGSEEDVPFTSATIFSLKTTKTRFALASDGKIYYQTYLREEVSAEDATQIISIYSEWFEVSPEKVIEELSQRVSKLEVPAHEELVETTLEELQSEGVTVGTGTITDNTWSYIGADSMTINTCGRVAFSIESQTDVNVYIDDVLYGLGSFDGVVNQKIVLKSTTLSSCSITFSRFAVTKAVGGILSDEQAKKVIKTEVYTTAEKNKLASMNAYTASEKYQVDRLSKIKDAGYTWVQKNLIELQNEGMLIASEGVVVKEDDLSGGEYSEVTINVNANIYMYATFGGTTVLYIDGERIGAANEYSYEGYAHNVMIKTTGSSLDALNVIFKIAQYNGGFVTDEQINDIEQVKYNTNRNTENINILNTKSEGIKDAKTTTKRIALRGLYDKGQITNDTSELICTLSSIEAPSGGDTIIQYTGKVQLALDAVENLALYIDDVLIEDNEFYGTINNNITLKDNGTGGYTANFSRLRSPTYTGGMFTDAEYEVYENLKYDFDEAEVLLDEVRQKTDAHITNKSNPHGVTASQINAFTKAQTRTEIQTVVDAARVEIDSKKADKDDVSNAFGGQASGELIQLTDISPIVHGIKVKCSPGVKVTRCGENLLPYPYYHTTRTSNGVTWTDNGDGSLTVNGTAIGNNTAVFYLAFGALNLKDGVTYYVPDLSSKGLIVRIMYQDESGTTRYASPSLTWSKAYTFDRIYVGVPNAGTSFTSEVVYPYLSVREDAEYEPYKSEVFTADADGNAIIPSVYPTTTLFTDVDGAMIEAEYNKDLNKVFGDIDEALDAILAIQEQYLPQEAVIEDVPEAEGGDVE